MSFQSFRLKAPILQGLKSLRLSGPNPTQKKVMNAMKGAKDLLVVSTAKEKPELGALILAINDLVKQEVRSGTRIILLHPEGEKAAKLSEWIAKLVNGTGLEITTLTSDLGKDEIGKKVAKGSQVLVSTPATFRFILESSKIVFRDLRLLCVVSASKVDPFEDLFLIADRCVGPEQRVFITGKTPKENVQALAELLPNAVSVEDAQEGDSVQGEANEITAGGDEEAGVAVAAQSPRSSDIDKDEPGSAPEPESEAEPESAPHSTPDSKRNVASENTESQATPFEPPVLNLLEKIHISDHTQIQALQNLILENSDKRMVVFVIGPAESDALFKALRAKELNLVSVHGKLRRQTYEYRLSRFGSREVDIAVIGGGVKAEVVFEDIDHLYFSYVPKSVESLARALTYIRFKGSSEVSILSEPSHREALDQIASFVNAEVKRRIMEGLSLNEFGRPGQKPTVTGEELQGSTARETKPAEEKKGKGARSQSEQKSNSHSAAPHSLAPRSPSAPSTPKTPSAGGPKDSRPRSSEGQIWENDKKGRDGKHSKGRGNRHARGGSQQSSGGTRDQGDARGGKGQGKGHGKGQGQARAHGASKGSQRLSPSSSERPSKSPYGLPMPTYDRLEGGRAGKKKETGILGKIKRLFGG